MTWLNVLSASSPLAVLLLGACFRTLRSIDRRLAATALHDFGQDLHILDHEQRLKALDPGKVPL